MQRIVPALVLFASSGVAHAAGPLYVHTAISCAPGVVARMPSTWNSWTP
jgi:hypothetical protein